MLGSVAFDGIYRTSSSTLTASNRRVQEAVLTFGTPVVLSAGTYWFDFNETYSGASGFMVPISLIGAAGVTGNALGFASGNYSALLDTGSGYAQGIPFLFYGSTAAIPEPATFVLAGLLGAAGLIWRRQKR